MTPLERAANAIVADYERQVQSGEFVRQENGDIKLNASAFARAVLKAIREPSKAMTDAGGEREYAGEADGEDVNVSAGDYAAGVIYRAMIDAALEEG
jgi:hypothetical protein